MEIYENLPYSSGNKVITIGNFDGLHRGHLAVIKRARRYARSNKMPLSVLTFEPDPVAYSKKIPPFKRRLLTRRDKLRIIDSLEVDSVYEISFDEKFASRTAGDFIREDLIKRLNSRAVFVGYDFKFGARRKGNVEFLKKFETDQFEVFVIDPVKNGKVSLSSSKIRAKIQTGDVETARELLTRPYTVFETLQTGSGRGRKLGFPTLNFSLKRTIRPRFGVYMVWLGLKERIPALASFGVHPTVDELKSPVLEVHTLQNPPDIATGDDMHIYFEKFCRPEEKFSSLDELKTKIKEDVNAARRQFSRLDKPAPLY